ncbi:MAG: hypothetical protein J5852_04075 [Clostridia bacterium]|nr:hypothetical protein [Clostridia bacterium]
MEGYKKPAKAALYLVYVFDVLLAAISVGLPFIVTWYVETRGRDQTLPVTVMLTCYPCLPFAAAILISLRRILKNVLSGLILGDKNLKLLNAAAISSFAITAITVAAGRQYKPFYIIAFAAAALGLVFFVVKSLFSALLQKQREKDLGDIEEEL